jgi:hypothetical protein
MSDTKVPLIKNLFFNKKSFILNLKIKAAAVKKFARILLHKKW